MILWMHCRWNLYTNSITTSKRVSIKRRSIATSTAVKTEVAAKGHPKEDGRVRRAPYYSSEGMKKLYTNVIKGKKPNEIITAHGFRPAVVETEYHRSQKLHDMLKY
jgi:hypothetical protein